MTAFIIEIVANICSIVKFIFDLLIYISKRENDKK